MTTPQTRTKYQRVAKKSKSNMEGEKSKTDEQEGLGSLVSEMMVKLTELNEKFRREESEANRSSLKDITNQFQAMQLSQMKKIDAQNATIRTPLPKYSGKPGEFLDWREGVQKCIKNNGWEDEKRILDMLPMALTGQAYSVFAALAAEQKTSLESVFASLKQSLDPGCRDHNREQFIRAKRSPGESMRAFISRCSTYITRADEIDNITDSPWAVPFLVEKIYGNLNPWDRKILKSGAGKSDDIHELTEKADELLAMSEDVVGSLHQEGHHGVYQGQVRQDWGPPRPRGKEGWRNENQLSPRSTGPPRYHHGRHYSGNQEMARVPPLMARPGGNQPRRGHATEQRGMLRAGARAFAKNRPPPLN